MRRRLSRLRRQSCRLSHHFAALKADTRSAAQLRGGNIPQFGVSINPGLRQSSFELTSCTEGAHLVAFESFCACAERWRRSPSPEQGLSRIDAPVPHRSHLHYEVSLFPRFALPFAHSFITSHLSTVRNGARAKYAFDAISQAQLQQVCSLYVRILSRFKPAYSDKTGQSRSLPRPTQLR